MNKNHSIQAELNELGSDLPLMPQPYTVPEGYFEGLAAAVLQRIKASEESAAAELESLSPLLAGLSRQMPQAVPEGYFNQNMAGMGAFTNADESPEILKGLSRTMPQSVPDGYFERLPAEILKKVAPAKVVPMGGRRWMRMAVAAMIAGAISIGGYFYMAGKTGGSSEQVLAGQLKNVSTSELDAFINSTSIASSSNTASSGKRTKPVNVEQLLQDVSDKELDAFLTQIPVADDDLYAIN